MTKKLPIDSITPAPMQWLALGLALVIAPGLACTLPASGDPSSSTDGSVDPGSDGGGGNPDSDGGGENPDIDAGGESPDIDAGVATPFLDYDCIGTGYDGIATTPSAEPYVPLIEIDEGKIIWAAPGGGGNGSSESSPTTLISAMNSAGEGWTIIALDGTHNVETVIADLTYVNIIAKNKHGAALSGKLTFSDNQDIHHISFIGFEISGGVFIFSPSTHVNAAPHHVYLADLYMHDMFMAFYSGLHSHDWTVDRCLYYNSTMSYLWYAMGWHHTVMNSVMYNNSYLSIAIRGHYPLDETFNYGGPNPSISSRSESYLDADDWTHKIINNTFGSNYDTSRPNQHMGLYYNAEEGTGVSEDSYFPPQNITIANNVFVDDGPLGKTGIIIYANRGVNTGAVDSVNGITITGNVTDKGALVVADTNISSVDLSGNTVNASAFGFDDGARDYALTAGSTALIDQGVTTTYVPNNDMRGQPRDSSPDVGAYER